MSLLTYLADDLVAVHGQSDQQQLLKPGRQRESLDKYAGAVLAEVLADYQRAYGRHRTVVDELTTLTTQARARAAEAAELRAGLEDIEKLNPAAGEAAALRAEEERLANADALHAAATTAHEALLGDPAAGNDGTDAVTLLGHARRALDAVRRHDAEIDGVAARLSEAAYLVSEVAGELASYVQGIDADPGPARRGAGAPGHARPGDPPVRPRWRQRAGQRGPGADPRDGGTRLTVAQRLTVTWHLTPARRTVTHWTLPSGQAPPPTVRRPGSPTRSPTCSSGPGSPRPGSASSTTTTRRSPRSPPTEAELSAQVTELAARLSRLRAEAGERFAADVTAELTALAMPHARISVALTTLAEPGPHGADDVEIRLAPHPGAPALPLHKGASGGELSRVMLAIEVVFAGADPVPTFVFDEVDAGVGGKAAVEIGRRLAKLARLAQVIVVTHLPQVAAFADNHLVVAKSEDGSITSTSVIRLEHEARVRELSRMLAGLEDSEFGQAHAAELLAMAADQASRA